MMSDLNDVWLQIIIDNGEDCKQAMNNKYEELTEEAESLRSAIRTCKTHETRMSAAAAFWQKFVEEEEKEAKCANKRVWKAMRRTTMDMQKAKSEQLLLQGLSSSGPSGSSKSTTATTTAADQDLDHSDCDVVVQGLKTDGCYGGFSGRGGEPSEPEEPIPEDPVAEAAATRALF